MLREPIAVPRAAPTGRGSAATCALRHTCVRKKEGGHSCLERVQTAAAAAAAAPAKPKKPKRGGGGGAARARTAVKLDGNTVDVRGERAADVGAPLARGLDRAAELGTCFVVHGHGDLRRAVRLALDDEPMVEKYEDADAASGGAGCTVVYLK